MKSFRALTGTIVAFGIAAAAQGCAATTSDGEDSEGAATIDTSQTKVSICGDDSETGGCNQCPAQIGDKQLTDPLDRDACTLKVLRSGLRARVAALIADAGRRGFFLRTGGGGTSPFKIAHIYVEPEIGGDKNSSQEHTKLSGVFSAGAENSARASIEIYSTYKPVKFGFEVVDTSGAQVSNEPYWLDNVYGMVPYFDLKTNAALNLNAGAILSKFPGGAVASTLLSALGGQLSVSLDAEHGKHWNEPACADRVGNPSNAGVTVLDTFDRDFYKALTKACVRMKADHPELNLVCTGMESITSTNMISSNQELIDEKVLPVQSCEFIDGTLGHSTFQLAFVAPRVWGFAKGQKGFLYDRNPSAQDVWARDNEVQILSTDAPTKCGGRTLKVATDAQRATGQVAPHDDEVCVYATVTKWVWGSTCDGIAASTSKQFGIAQVSDGPEDATLHFTLR